jgi:hypothetical protein
MSKQIELTQDRINTLTNTTNGIVNDVYKLKSKTYNRNKMKTDVLEGLIELNNAVTKKESDDAYMKINDSIKYNANVVKSIERELLKKQIKKENGIITTKSRGKYKKKEQAYYFITINSNNNTNVNEILKMSNKIASKKWLDVYCYVIEQRGTIERPPELCTLTDKYVDNDNYEGIGKHIHMLTKKTESVSKVIERLYNTCKHIANNMKCINVQKVYKQGAIIYYKYMMGQKAPYKMQCHKLTEKWRTNNGIKQMYKIKRFRYEDNEDIDDPVCILLNEGYTKQNNTYIDNNRQYMCIIEENKTITRYMLINK